MKTTTKAPVSEATHRCHAPAIPSPLEARQNGNSFDSISTSDSSSRADPVSRIRTSSAGKPKLKLVLIGLPIMSTSKNGHSATSSALFRGLAARGHDILLLERNPKNDEPEKSLSIPYGRVGSYGTLRELRDRHAAALRHADAVIIGSQTPEGVSVGEWALRIASGAVVFYDADTPVTLSRLGKSTGTSISADQISRYDLYLSATGGPVLSELERRFGSPMARALYPAVDTALYYPEACPIKYDLGYIGVYTEERQPALDELLLEPARNWDHGRFVVAGAKYPRHLRWPANVAHMMKVNPSRRRAFYCSQKFALNIPRADADEAEQSPSMGLFEAAACGTPIISSYWPGIEAFFNPDEEILISHSSEESLYYILETSEKEQDMLSKRARDRVLSSHTARHRAAELEDYICDVLKPTIVSAE